MYEITEDSIWNMDEKGVLLGLASASKIIRHKENGKRNGKGQGMMSQNVFGCGQNNLWKIDRAAC